MPLTDVFKEIISDFHARPLPALTPRNLSYEIVPSKIMTVTGVRRSGKTFFLFQIMRSLMEKGLPKESILFMNFEDERLGELKAADLGLLLEAYYELYPSKKMERVSVFLDEVQNVSGWEKFVRRVHDSENVQLFLTGSSAKLLSREIATTLRGRSINYEIFPFSFEEFLRHRSIDPEKRFVSAVRAKVKNAFQDYFLRGGFPEVLDVSENVRQKILQDYLQLILYKDMIERHGLKNHALVKYFLKHMLQNPACPLSIHKLYRDLRSQGFRVSKDSLHQYGGCLEDAYTFFSVPIFSESLRVQQVHYKKWYAIDVGLSQACIFGLKEKRGALLENLVYLQLRGREGYEIYYYLTKSRQEIDFLVMRRGAVHALIQVTDHLDQPITRQRETDPLFQAMVELKTSKAFLITRDTREEMKRSGKTIKIMPFWEWALES